MQTVGRREFPRPRGSRRLYPLRRVRAGTSFAANASARRRVAEAYRREDAGPVERDRSGATPGRGSLQLAAAAALAASAVASLAALARDFALLRRIHRRESAL